MQVTGRLSERAWGWIGPVGVALLAFCVRVWNVGQPKTLVFDETYYAKDAWSLLQRGYVQDYVKDADAKIVSGDLTGLTTGEPSWVVHPDGGRILIALGEKAFGLDAFGWRISAVVFGSLTVLILARMVRRLTGSTLLGCFAGLFLAFDGAHFVLSRTALLDVFLAFWLVAAVAALVVAREAMVDGGRYRTWQVVAGLCFGMACATKWSGLYGLAAFAVVAVLWEVAHRRGTGSRVATFLRAALPAFATLVLVAGAVYLLTWTGWLIHHDAYEARFGRGYGDYSAPWGAYVDRPSGGFLGETVDALRSLWHFHVMTYDFHTQGLDRATHPYASHPIGWLVMERPVGVDAQNDLPAASCGAAADSSCMRVITILANPAVWWSGAAASVVAVVAWVRTRDARWAVPVVGVLSGWLPWFANADRPIFSFYAVTVLPFMIVALAMLVGAAWDATTTPRGRYVVWVVSGSLLAAVITLFWYFHPILTDQLVPYDTWYARMWFSRWI